MSLLPATNQPRLQKLREFRTWDVLISQPLHKALRAQIVPTFSIGARHTSVAAQGANSLALQVTSGGRFNVL
jgi:hypothetical protein